MNGRWKRTLTIQQATQFILTNTTAKVTPAGQPTRTFGVGELSSNLGFTSNPAFLVTSLNGTPLRDRAVTFGIEAGVNGAGATIVSGANRTAPDGRANVVVRANTIAGTYAVTATVDGVVGRIQVTNAPGSPANIIMTGGSSQTATAGAAFPQPVSGRVLDVYGNAVPNVELLTSEFPVDSLIASPLITTDAAGVFSFSLAASEDVPNQPSLSRGVAQLEIRSVLNSALSRSLVFQIVPGPLDTALVLGDGQSAPVGTSFPSPVVTVAVDEFSNGVPGVGVTYHAIPGPSGASGTVPSPSGSTDSAGEFSRSVTANSTAGAWTLRVEVAGLGTLDLTMTNTP